MAILTLRYEARSVDHGREPVVRTGRKSSKLGREPDPRGRSIALTCEVGGSPSEPTGSRPWSHDLGLRS
jgi:hypothetical protein